jgi:hypothetical protein
MVRKFNSQGISVMRKFKNTLYALTLVDINKLITSKIRSNAEKNNNAMWEQGYNLL